jgi:hypothetical protein
VDIGEYTAYLKKPSVIIGAIITFVIFYLIARATSGKAASSGGQSNYAEQNAAINQTNAASAISIANINSQVDIARLQAGVATISATMTGQANLAGIEAGRTLGLAKVASDENVGLSSIAANRDVTMQGQDYQYSLGNKQLENNRVLGLNMEDTKRLISTQENHTKLTLGLRAIDSQEQTQLEQLAVAREKLASDERMQDLTTSRALTFQTITGQNQVNAAKAAKPSWFETLMGGLGGVGKIIAAF